MRIVIDTNVLIDAGDGFFGAPRQVLDLCLQNKITPILSEEITDENWHIIEKLVKDDRTKIETSKAEEVLNGDLDIFVEAEVELLR